MRKWHILIILAEDDMAYLAWDGHIYHKYYYPTNQIDLVNNKETARGRMVPRNDREFLKNVLYVYLN